MSAGLPSGNKAKRRVPKSGSTSAYGNVPATLPQLPGVRFASRAEARRAAQLLVAQAAGQLRNLQLQPRYVLRAVPPRVAYTADFAYDEPDGAGGWHPVVEEVKGRRARDWRVRAAWLLSAYPHLRLRVFQPKPWTGELEEVPLR